MPEELTPILQEFPYIAIILAVVWFFVKYNRDRDDKFLEALKEQGQENRKALSQMAKEQKDSSLELSKTIQKMDTILEILVKKVD